MIQNFKIFLKIYGHVTSWPSSLWQKSGEFLKKKRTLKFGQKFVIFKNFEPKIPGFLNFLNHLAQKLSKFVYLNGKIEKMWQLSRFGICVSIYLILKVQKLVLFFADYHLPCKIFWRLGLFGRRCWVGPTMRTYYVV